MFTSIFNNVVDKVLKGIREGYLFYPAIAYIGMYTVYSYTSSLVIPIVGAILPTYKTVQYLHDLSKRQEIKKETKGFITSTTETIVNEPDSVKKGPNSILKYWVAFGSFYTVTFITDSFLYWMPLYSTLKVSSIVLLWFPIFSERSGAVILYDDVIHPFMESYREELECISMNVYISTRVGVTNFGVGFIDMVRELGPSDIFKAIANGLRKKKDGTIMSDSSDDGSESSDNGIDESENIEVNILRRVNKRIN